MDCSGLKWALHRATPTDHRPIDSQLILHAGRTSSMPWAEQSLPQPQNSIIHYPIPSHLAGNPFLMIPFLECWKGEAQELTAQERISFPLRMERCFRTVICSHRSSWHRAITSLPHRWDTLLSRAMTGLLAAALALTCMHVSKAHAAGNLAERLQLS